MKLANPTMNAYTVFVTPAKYTDLIPTGKRDLTSCNIYIRGKTHFNYQRPAPSIIIKRIYINRLCENSRKGESLNNIFSNFDFTNKKLTYFSNLMMYKRCMMNA